VFDCQTKISQPFFIQLQADTAAATNEAAKAANLAKDASVAARSKASAEALCELG
jgi:hypothetical protein